MELNNYIGLTALLYSLANPVGVIPIFLDIVSRRRDVHPRRLIALAAIAVATILSLSALLGQGVLQFFHVDLNDFRIAGGLLALFIAFEMFQARYGGVMQTSEERTEASDDSHGIAISPLAFPLLTGPAEMSIMMTIASDHSRWCDKLALVATAVVVAILIGLTLLAAVSVRRLIGKTGINIATRVMALFVAAVGVDFIFTGIRGELPGLA